MAAFLLLLYGFIATPVHWWHHHQQGNATTRMAAAAHEDNDILTQGAGASYASHCNVCSHSYSVYAVAEAYQYTLPVLLHNSPTGGYIEHAFTIPVLLFSNKGPPAILV